MNLFTHRNIMCEFQRFEPRGGRAERKAHNGLRCCNQTLFLMGDEGPSVAELLAALEEGGGVQGDDKWKRLGIDFDKWNWWSANAAQSDGKGKRAMSCPLDDEQV